MNRRVAVIGAGNVGASTGLYLAERGLADVVLIDIVEGMPQGKALDMTQTTPLWHRGGRIEGSNDLAAVKGANLVIMTAGFPRKPGMSRSDLLKANADIIRPAAEAVKRHAPDATAIVVTNPLDVMAWLFWKVSGLPKGRVVGMAGILDAARFRAFIALELGVRFLADYLRGDSYFRLCPGDPPDLNRTRALVQLTLFERLQARADAMRRCIAALA